MITYMCTYVDSTEHLFCWIGGLFVVVMNVRKLLRPQPSRSCAEGAQACGAARGARYTCPGCAAVRRKA